MGSWKLSHQDNPLGGDDLVKSLGTSSRTMSDLPVIAITMGDPAGVGPEVILKALARPEPWEVCNPLVVGDPLTLQRVSSLLGIRIPIKVVDVFPQGSTSPVVSVIKATQEDLAHIQWGKVDPRCGRAQVDFLQKALNMALAGEVQAMVTAPIHKVGLKLAGVAFPGHTEMLAQWTNTRKFAMMLAGKFLRVVLVTIHCSLKEALERLSMEGIKEVALLAHRALRDWFGIKKPRLAISGLNPHAGDQGLFGDEEERIITPAVRILKHEGLHVTGPVSPDAVFCMAADGVFDVVVAMYHDQGLIPLKLLERHGAVNLTLGLPIIRTSVDHGTAYDIAGTGKASEQSLLEALMLAARLACHAGLNKSENASQTDSGKGSLPA
ncbi:MAG: 4-hydroxythreonine-4-phosphate dehydrogenase PdxA [bacterium]